MSPTEKPEWTLVLDDGDVEVRVTIALPSTAKAEVQLDVVPAIAVPKRALFSAVPKDELDVGLTAPRLPVHDAPSLLYATKVNDPVWLLLFCTNNCRLVVAATGTYCNCTVVPFNDQVPAVTLVDDTNEFAPLSNRYAAVYVCGAKAVADEELTSAALRPNPIVKLPPAMVLKLTVRVVQLPEVGDAVMADAVPIALTPPAPVAACPEPVVMEHVPAPVTVLPFGPS